MFITLSNLNTTAILAKNDGQIIKNAFYDSCICVFRFYVKNYLK